MAPAPGAWRHTRSGGNSPRRSAERTRRGEPGEVRGHVHPSRTLDGLSGHPPSRPGGHHRHRAAATTAHRRHVHPRARAPRPPARPPPPAPPRRQTDFTAAAALQFPVAPGTLPNPFMGDRLRPVNIWQWKASWQDELTRARDLRVAYPDMAVDYYYDTQFLKDEAARRAFNAGAAAGNLLSLPRRASAVEDLVAWGFGTLDR